MLSVLQKILEKIEISVRISGEDDVRTKTSSRNTNTEVRRTNRDQEDLIYNEARTVLEYQIETLNDIDDKAARTVRITALLVGAVFGAISFGDKASLIVNEYTWWGSVSLLLAVVLGMATYSQSSPYFGPRPDDWRTLRTDGSKQGTVRLLIEEGYRGWIDYNDSINKINTYFLLLTQWSLATSLLLFGVGLTSEFANGEPYVPKFSLLAEFSHSLPLVSFPLTPASLPVFLLFTLAVIMYVYSLLVKSRGV